MDGARLQSLADKGMRISARQVGLPHQHYRPSGVSTPIAVTCLLGVLPAAFSVGDYKFGKAQPYAKSGWVAIVDRTAVAVGDYLVGDRTFFVASQDALVPVMAIECNKVLTLSRPTSVRTLGRVHAVSGDVISQETSLQQGWPASVLQGTKGEAPSEGIPGGARDPWWTILMPVATGVSVEMDDILTDEADRRYQVSSAELTSKGWRISAQLADD